MASLQSISAAIQAIPLKKEKLRKTFEDLQSHSACLAAFNLQWKDLEDHLDEIEKMIEKRFKDLESAEQQGQPTDPLLATKSQSSDLLIWPELRTFCSKMKSTRLMSFILEHQKDGVDIKSELDDALRLAPEPAKLVLKSIKGFYPTKAKGNKNVELASVRRACILLLQRLAAIAPVIKDGEREQAKEMALEWKKEVYGGDDSLLEGMAFFQFLATYGLVHEFDLNDLLDILCVIARRRQTIELCKTLGLTDKVPDLIKKLISKGKQHDAVKFVYAFELVDKFPPIPLLNAHLKEAKRVAEEVRKRGNNSAQSLNEAATKEIASLRAIIKSVEDHNLQSEFSCEQLEERITQLEKQKADRKRTSTAKPQLPSPQQPTNKRQKPDSSQPAGLWGDHVNPYSVSTGLHGLAGGSGLESGLYGFAGGSGAAPVSSAPYAVPGSSGFYGSALAAGSGALQNPLYDHHLGSSFYGGYPTPPRSHFLHSDAFSSSLYDRPMGSGGYPGGLPPFHPPFFP